MNSMTNRIFFFVMCAVMMISLHQSASACQVDEYYHTKEGVLAASTPEGLLAAVALDNEGNKDKLAALMKDGTVQRLKENVKVQVLERSFEFEALKIKFPDKSDAYWVKDGSLKQIDCK